MAEQTPLSLTSPAFQPGQPIPQEYTADGKNLAPPLHWGEVPSGTQSLALICEDPDAPRGTFAHWVAYNLSPKLRALDDSLAAQETADGSVQGTLVHLLWAEWIWLERWLGRSPKQVFGTGDFPDLAAIEERLATIQRGQEAFIETLTDDRKDSYFL